MRKKYQSYYAALFQKFSKRFEIRLLRLIHQNSCWNFFEFLKYQPKSFNTKIDHGLILAGIHQKLHNAMFWLLFHFEIT